MCIRDRNRIVLIMDISTSVPTSIYPITSGDTVNLKIADRNPIQTSNTVTIL